jgi:hypothetical protein
MMNGLKDNKRLLLWVLVPLVVIAEVFLQWRIPRQEPSEEDWKAAAAAVKAEKKPGDLVVIAPDWAVQGRMYFKSMMSWKDFGRFDTSTYSRIFEVSMMGAKGPETLGLVPLTTQKFGKMTVTKYKLPAPDKVIFDFTDHLKDAALKRVEKKPRILIDHKFIPRRVAAMRLLDVASLEFDQVPMKGTLLVYGIIGYLEARFDDGEPVRLSVFVNDKRIAVEHIANFDVPKPFEYTLPGGLPGKVRFEVFASDNKKREFGLKADVRVKGGR